MFSKYYIPTIVWMLIILYLSAFSGPQIDFKFDLFGADKISHFAAYGLLSVLMGWAYFKDNQRFTTKVISVILVIGFTYGVVMEIMQYLFFPNRYFDYGDIIANFIGNFFGLIIIRIYCLNYK